MEENRDTFSYTYSAKEQEEIRKIRDKYIKKSETPMEQLRRLDASATRGAAVVSLIVGILGALVMGVGMCCTMVWGNELFFPGVLIGIAGIAGVIAAYPVYTRMVRRKREKLAPEILRLSDELMR